jgi:hypothetical protein
MEVYANGQMLGKLHQGQASSWTVQIPGQIEVGESWQL